jgi:hypothetical protein
MRKIVFSAAILLFFLNLGYNALAQEKVGPLRFNPALQPGQSTRTKAALKTTSLGLPFFEDFTDESPYPNASRWSDSSAFINNNMGAHVISRGVATFDALTKYGRPYDTTNRFSQVYADSLTTQYFDLSSYVPNDSIYLSFFYQPQGMGFSPEVSDSLMLFFQKKSGGWNLIWSVPGDDVKPFKQILIPVADTTYLFDGFRFRFVNKASLNTNDDVWNVDYIRMASNRNYQDTAVSDLAYTVNPGFLLNDYISMPYRQYLANPAGERTATFSDSIWNHYRTPASVNYRYDAVETTTGTALSSGTGTVTIAPDQSVRVSFPTYTTLVTPPSTTTPIIYRNVFRLQSGNPVEPKDNDSAVCEQIFDNYLAYDDGTAEKCYFLNMGPSLPGKTALEFRLNVPDTLRGAAIYFGQQVPPATSKFFSIAVYKQLAGIAGAGADDKIFEQTDLQPMYTDAINHFTVYKFDSPIELPAGVFYLGTVQPAYSGSDSLYFGLDVNRQNGNHLYVNVSSLWYSSIVSGAVMIRPLLGRPVTGTAVNDQTKSAFDWSLSPNPATTELHLESTEPSVQYRITDIQGRNVQVGMSKFATVPINDLSTGLYLLSIQQRNGWTRPQKFIKQ